MLVKYLKSIISISRKLLIPWLNLNVQKFIKVNFKHVYLKNIHVFDFFFEPVYNIFSLLLNLFFLHFFDFRWNFFYVIWLLLRESLQYGSPNLDDVIQKILVESWVSNPGLIDKLFSLFRCFHSNSMVDLRL